MSRTMHGSFRGPSPVALRSVGGVSVLALALAVAAGCSRPIAERGWGNPCKVQVQFYSPPGAEVQIKSLFGRRAQEITTDESLDHRLELTPEEYAVFNLCPGRYQFKYTTAQGFPGVSIYGRLDVQGSLDCEVAKFVRNSFIPIKLPSRYYLEARSLHPVMGPSGPGLHEIEVDQLAQGDLIEKVYFIADLDTVYKDIDRINARLDQLRSAETVLNSSKEYLDARHEDYRRDSIYADPTFSIDDATKEFWGADRRFNQLEADRQRLENQRYAMHEQITRLTEERRMRRTLLDSMRIINRSGALVLATPEYQWPYHDTFHQVAHGRSYEGFIIGPGLNYHVGDFRLAPIGKVVAVMQVGGRHKHWGDLESAVAERGENNQEYDTLEYREEVRGSKPGTTVE
ncbi:MAG: hypothetical protein V2A79_09330 [Planctomycetota bacterium]